MLREPRIEQRADRTTPRSGRRSSATTSARRCRRVLRDIVAWLDTEGVESVSPSFVCYLSTGAEVGAADEGRARVV